jgi:predicted nuclease of predicted toxin-antitoxin system
VRFLIDEMFSPAVARHLTDLGHDAQHVRDIGLAGRTDDEVFDRATVEDRVVVTENAVDFVALLEAAGSTGAATPPVVLALKHTLPADAGAMANELARRLARWADNHPDPNRHVHGLT